ncbi:HAD-IA family hydrolase [Angustibacter sp. McL0619]|uniref:HAD-IA family hydrolase n=1 Tax=Angustibacter sp. McL0619 TaxID=3415676 RepID=UPI003CEC2F79
MTDQLPRTDLADRTFAAVLFDLDGTLVDSTAAVLRSWVTWAIEHDVDPLRLQGFHGVPARQIVSQLVHPDQVDSASQRIDDLELTDVTGVVGLPGAAEALAALPAGRAAVVTSCTRLLAEARIGAAGLQPPGAVVTADDVTHGKPDPEPFLLGAERLGVPPGDCLVVEDAPMGLASARAAGMATLAVTTTTAAADLDADLVVTSLADVELRSTSDGVRVVRRSA